MLENFIHWLKIYFCLFLLGSLYQSEVMTGTQWFLMADITDSACLTLLRHIHFLMSKHPKSYWLLESVGEGWNFRVALYTWKQYLLWYMKEGKAGCSVQTYQRFFYHRLVHSTQTAPIPNASTWATLRSYQRITPWSVKPWTERVSGFKMALNMLSRSYRPSGKRWLLRKAASWSWNASWNVKPLDFAFS